MSKALKLKNLVIKFKLEIYGIIICLTLGLLSGLVVKISDYSWYNNLLKPSFNPPNWVFRPVWSFIYVTIGIIFGILYKNINKNCLLFSIFSIQFILNILWSPLLFSKSRLSFLQYYNSMA